jgi:hypothetical protein
MTNTNTATLEALQPAANLQRIDAHIVLESVLGLENPQASLFRHIAPGEMLHVPTNFVGERGDRPFPVVVPSLEVVSPLGNEARVVSLQETHPGLHRLYDETVKTRKGTKARVLDMIDEAVVRLLDSEGHSGLHHLHHSIFPNTVYYLTRRGHGIQPNVYLTELGKLPNKVPVIAMLTATKDKRSEYAFFRLVGAGQQKKGHTP